MHGRPDDKLFWTDLRRHRFAQLMAFRKRRAPIHSDPPMSRKDYRDCSTWERPFLLGRHATLSLERQHPNPFAKGG